MSVPRLCASSVLRSQSRYAVPRCTPLVSVIRGPSSSRPCASIASFAPDSRRTAAASSVFGASEFVGKIALDAPDVALHVSVESVDRAHRLRLLTEGVQRIGAGLATVRIRPVAFELPPGWSLRLSIAGADAPSFERVPATGGQRMQFAGEGCRLTVPVVQ